MPKAQGKNCEKILAIGGIGPEQVADGDTARRRLCRRAFGHVTVTVK